ncbi:hypothetical protein MNQ95_02160 [Pseudoxanthomonas daejeonensis]|jgi:hypothetical protein|uniref:Transmembrane protein n=1 Tax=Pseudoxanthomonas daejeonensis TaxID=266062 RepID=A0ABQ6Z6F0_9GAMM|nr:hypothetical protein [Pseudoxanthomonas daejeonensis]KAF1693518.1 hypothetical protein CSC65_12000 [Pseudoxanthomonas daejeonensis]UNK57937.1 hypothetical protein MNQ95_02160 [Pseudoxanthomonas daejeonensis]
MKSAKGLWILLVPLAGFGLWSMLASPRALLGIDPGPLGMFALVASTVAALLLLSRTPRENLDRASPAEWKAWLGVGFMLAGVLYFLSRIPLFAAGDWRDPHAGAVARNLVLLLVVWTVLSSVLAARWKGRVQEDERDRDIEASAVGWGRGALVSCVVGIAVLLGFSPPARLQWANHFMVANLLVFALMWGWLVEYAATALMYLRDRRGAGS